MNGISGIVISPNWRGVTRLPVASFGSVLGPTVLSVAWSLAQDIYGAPPIISAVFAGIALAAFVIVSVSYAVKLILAPSAVRAEIDDPVIGPLFGTVIIALLLLPILIAPSFLALARLIWAGGVVLMVLFAWWVVSRWLSGKQRDAIATPTWLVPFVGMLDIPLAESSLNMTGFDAGAFGLSIGFFGVVPLATIFLSRVITGPPIPASSSPVLMILIAPFAVGFLAYTSQVHEIDGFARSLYFMMLFLAVPLVFQLRHLRSCCPFRLSWWAIGFPLAASAVAALTYAHKAPSSGAYVAGAAFLVFATAINAGLLVRTVIGISRGEIATLST